jgi:hypothetical protein
MNFEPLGEVKLLQQTLQSVLAGLPQPVRWEPGRWHDDHSEAVAGELGRVGWTALWESDEGLRFAVAGGLVLGRTLAPLSLVDLPALGALLWLDGLVRYGRHGAVAARPAGRGLVLLGVPADAPAAATMDDIGAVFVGEPRELGVIPEPEAGRRLRTWAACTTAYLAGLAGEALKRALDYARVRQQFGKPLASQPVVQQYLADGAVGVEGLELLAWELVAGTDWVGPLLYAGSVAVAVTDTAQQLLGAYGFAVESGAHRFYRRAKAMAVWNRRLIELSAVVEDAGAEAGG